MFLALRIDRVLLVMAPQHRLAHAKPAELGDCTWDLLSSRSVMLGYDPAVNHVYLPLHV
jgi:hypothetical protein